METASRLQYCTLCDFRRSNFLFYSSVTERIQLTAACTTVIDARRRLVNLPCATATYKTTKQQWPNGQGQFVWRESELGLIFDSNFSSNHKKACHHRRVEILLGFMLHQFHFFFARFHLLPLLKRKKPCRRIKPKFLFRRALHATHRWWKLRRVGRRWKTETTIGDRQWRQSATTTPAVVDLHRNYYEMEIKLHFKFRQKIKAESRNEAERERS